MSSVEEKHVQEYLNDPNFFERFFYQYKDYVKFLVRKKCSNPSDVEDITQITWELLLRNIDKLLNVSENKQASYISVVVSNVLKMEARKKRLDTCSLDDIPEPGYDPTLVLNRVFDQELTKLHFRNVWSKIDPYVREILERRYIMDQSYQEIAVAMQIAPNNVRIYIHRARKVAKRELLKQNKTLDQQWHDAFM